jgi:hypothetical protein
VSSRKSANEALITLQGFQLGKRRPKLEKPRSGWVGPVGSDLEASE